MTRVAKAQRKAGIQLSVDPEPQWQARDEASDTERDDSPWHIETPAIAPPSQDAPEIDFDIPDVMSAAPPGVREHVVGLVRRVFLPPPTGAGIRSVLFSAADGGRDSSRVSVASAELLAAHTSKRVCLVDTSMKIARIGDGSHNGAQGSADATKQVSRNLWIAAPGRAVGSARVESARRQLTELSARFDYVVFDSPAMNAPGAPAAIAALVEGVILVVDEAATRRDAARNVSEALQAAGARLLGVVLANREYPIPARLYRWL